MGVRGRGRLAALALCTLLVSSCLPGCVAGLVYTHVTVPLDVDFDETPIQTDRRSDDSWKTLVIPLIGLGGRLRFDWGDDSIGTAEREAGIETVYYADLETLSVLGIWTQRWVHVYGQ